MLTRSCPVKRPYQTVVLGPAPVAAKVPLMPNGQPTGMNLQAQTFAQDYHELRVFDANQYEMYCIYCGHIDKQSNWFYALREDISESQKG